MPIETNSHAPLEIVVCEAEILEGSEAERDFIRSLKNEHGIVPLTEVKQTSEREPISVRHDELTHRVYDGMLADSDIELDICAMGISESSKVLQRIRGAEKQVHVTNNITAANILAMFPVAVEK